MPYRERLRDRPYEARQPAFMSVVPIPAEVIPKDEERLKCVCAPVLRALFYWQERIVYEQKTFYLRIRHRRTSR